MPCANIVALDELDAMEFLSLIKDKMNLVEMRQASA